MKFLYTILTVLSTHVLIGQTFTESSITPPFQPIADGVIAMADIDGDGDQDVLITGSDVSSNGVSKLYTNDGGGTFSEVPNVPFEQLGYSMAAFSDVDGDGDQDLLISGRIGFTTYTGNLYLNDGQGNFSAAANSPIIKAAFGDISFGDVDNDGDEDVFVNGAISSNEIVAKLYLNDGQGNFSEVSNTPFAPVGGASAFADIDNDGDLDLALGGSPVNGGTRVVKLYTNDGAGTFSEVPNTSFTGVASCDIGFSDVDGDGDQDMVVLGHTNSYVGSTRLYKNNGGTFIAVASPFKSLSYGRIAFADLDADGFEELLITGIDNDFVSYSNLYKNNAGTFSLVAETPFVKVGYSALSFADLDGDNDKDVILCGATGSGLDIGLYFNQSMVSSTADTSLPPPAFESQILHPIISNTLNVNIVSQKNQTVFFSVFDVKGQLITGPLQEQAGAGTNTYSLDLPDMGSGVYLLQIRTQDKMITERFVKL